VMATNLVSKIETDEVAHEVLASLRRRNRNNMAVDSPMQVNEFNHIVDRSVLAVQMCEHTAARKLPNSNSRDHDVEQRLLAAIDQHIPTKAAFNSKNIGNCNLLSNGSKS